VKAFMPVFQSEDVKRVSYSGLNCAAVVLAGILMLFSVSVSAVIEIAPLSTAEREGRYRELIEELRCPKCQNQNLADSNSPIAADLRQQIRELLEQGKSDDEVVAYLVDRYGEFVRYKPAVRENTLVLWFGPLVLVLGCLVVVVLVIRSRRQAEAGQVPLSTEEEARIKTMLESDAGEQRK
jgi:cytochrome c-type biogenesis protein CcmH